MHSHKTRFLAAAVVSIASAPAFAAPLPGEVDVTGIDGILTRWSLANNSTNEGSVSSTGSNTFFNRGDAFDGHHVLNVNGVNIRDTNSDFAVTTNARGTFIDYDPVVTNTGHTVQTKWAFLEGFGAFRMFTTITHTGPASDSVVTVRRSHNMGSDGSGVIIASGDGDNVAETTDGWFATDDSDPTGRDPAIIYSLSSGDAAKPIRVTNGGPTSNTWTDEFALELQQGESVSLMWFTQMFADTADAQAYAPNWDTISSPLLVGLTDDELNRVANHQVPEPSSLALLGLGGLALIRRRR